MKIFTMLVLILVVSGCSVGHAGYMVKHYPFVKIVTFEKDHAEFVAPFDPWPDPPSDVLLQEWEEPANVRYFKGRLRDRRWRDH